MRLAPRLLLVLVATAAPAGAQTVSKTVGKVTFRAELDRAWPGGLIVARLAARGSLGTVHAILDGRRAIFYSTSSGLRALVPVPSEATPGMDVTIAPREYAPREVSIPETRRHLPRQPAALAEARQMLLLVRTYSKTALARGPLRPPVAALPVASFGAPQRYEGGSPIEELTDGVFGERHRGLDYEVPEGTVVQAPGAAVVVSVSQRLLTGHTLVLDHGQGLVSVLAHLSRVDVREGEAVEGRAPLALSGSSGIAYAPHLHWAVYLHGIAIDPRVAETLAD
jgi:hypothetical protein